MAKIFYCNDSKCEHNYVLYLQRFNLLVWLTGFNKATASIVLMFMFIICSGSVGAQNKVVKAKNAIYIGGFSESATIVSVNYDRIVFTSDIIFLSASTGFGFQPVLHNLNLEPIIGVPLNFSCNVGRKNHFLDIGFGLKYSSGLSQHEQSNNEFYNNQLLVKRSILFNINFGYKYQPQTGGLFFKLGYSPMYELYIIEGAELNCDYPFFSVGLGFCF